MPDGVDTPGFVASKVNAGLKRARSSTWRGDAASSMYFSSGISGAPKPTKQDRHRQRLLAGARRGEPDAIRELRETLHAWIIPSREGRQIG